MKIQTRKHKGQGVVEYAGALVVAAVLVSGVLLAGPTGLGDTFTSIMTDVGNYLTGQVPGAGGGEG